MKTILIPIFQGVEARNILRTDIFKILKLREDLRIILLVPNQNKKKYFSEQFSGENIVYDVFDNYKNPFFYKLFDFLKYNLLRTERMDIRRRIKLNETKKYCQFAFKWLFNRIFARSFFRKIARYLDFLLVKDNNFVHLFDIYKPDLVLLAHLFGDVEISILREAKKRNIKSIGLINSWDKLTSRGIMRLLPDSLVVHNDIIKEEAVKHGDMKREKIQVVGIPHYDIYVDLKPRLKEYFYEKIAADINKRIILFCPVGQFFSNLDSEMINILTEFQASKQIPEDTQILVRFPPNDEVDLGSIKRKEMLLFYQPGIRFSARRGMDWDMNDEDNHFLLDTLFHSALIICPPSSLSIDAAVFDKPIINLKFKRYMGYYNQNINLFYDADHYNNIIKTGGIKVVEDEKELLFWINYYLANPRTHSAERKTIVDEQCWRLDGQAGERVARFILKNL